ncbi:MAG: lipoyl synthase [candidate division Zixibacteria bacterium]|nr:lipoyl synthase [candidate division Zixibacteria bacterium]
MNNNNQYKRKPPWLKIKPNFGTVYGEVKSLLEELNLHTVCQEANCPNMGECFSAGTATFIILGDRCTRNCRFCDVKPGKPAPPDADEPNRIADAVRRLKLKFAVITMVTRDDLPDGGAEIFAETIRQIRHLSPDCKVEALISDLGGNADSLDIIIDSAPDVLAHNIETAPELYPAVRPQADYNRSLEVLNHAFRKAENTLIKSGIMVGLGENFEQIESVLSDAVRVGCRIFTVGQYLSPSKKHLPITKYYTPEEFEEIKVIGEKLGIKHVESGPLVRSSYMAHRQAESAY